MPRSRRHMFVFGRNLYNLDLQRFPAAPAASVLVPMHFFETKRAHNFSITMSRGGSTSDGRLNE